MGVESEIVEKIRQYWVMERDTRKHKIEKEVEGKNINLGLHQL